MHRRLPLILLLVLLPLLAIPAATATSAWAASRSTLLQRPVLGTIAEDSSNPRVALAPIRFDAIDAPPGTELRYELTVRNTLTVPVTLSTYAFGLEGSRDPDRFAAPARPTARSTAAADWVTWPGFGKARTMPPSTELHVPVSIQVPDDAAPGSYAIGLAVTQRVSAPGTDIVDTPESRVRLAVDLASIAVVRVPGDATAEVRLRSITSPRVVWRDRSPDFNARVVNAGQTDLLIDGKIDLDAFLGSAGRTLDAIGPAKGQPALPGGVRVVRMRWSDPPLVGWFRPTLVVVGGKGSNVRIEKELDTVWVLPPWWLMLAIALAIGLPIWLRRRRRRDPAFQQARRARAHDRVEARLRRDEARRRAAAARRKR